MKISGYLSKEGWIVCKECATEFESCDGPMPVYVTDEYPIPCWSCGKVMKKETMDVLLQPIAISMEDLAELLRREK